MKLNRTILRRVAMALLLMALLLPAWAPAVATATSADHLVTQISLAPRTPDILGLNEQVTVSFSYSTAEAGGVRIFVRPFTGGALTPHYAASGSPLYPAGTGTGSGDFTITSGDVTVNRVHFEMWDADQTTLLFQAFVPVHYQFTSAISNVVNDIGLTDTPNVLVRGQHVAVSFHYQTTVPAGVRIFVRPLTHGSLTATYAASPSPLYPVGTGVGRGWFTITRGDRAVTQVRIQMWNATQTRLLFQALVPVSYQFKGAATLVDAIGLTPANPNILAFGQQIKLTLAYTTNAGGGVRIFAFPVVRGVATPEYAYGGSPLYAVGTGTADRWFTIVDGTMKVDHIDLQVWDADQTTLLFETFIPVSYQFK